MEFIEYLPVRKKNNKRATALLQDSLLQRIFGKLGTNYVLEKEQV